MWWSLLLACGGGEPDKARGPVDTDEPALRHQLSFVVIADPHIVPNNADRESRLAAAVDWINDHSQTRKIEVVWVVGDVGWGGGLDLAKASLDRLDVPYVPVIGDNEIHFGDEAEFGKVFDPQYDRLGKTFDNFQRGRVKVYNPEHKRDSWFYNFSFDFADLHWIGLDWCSRHDDNLFSETADLHDFDGGTWPFFEDEVRTLEPGPDENVLMFSHHAMHLQVGAFGADEMTRITGLTSEQAHRVAGSWAGHYHLNAEEEVVEGGYEIFVTDATWDDLNTVRLVEVWGNGERQRYEQELVVVED